MGREEVVRRLGRLIKAEELKALAESESSTNRRPAVASEHRKNAKALSLALARLP